MKMLIVRAVGCLLAMLLTTGCTPSGIGLPTSNGNNEDGDLTGILRFDGDTCVWIDQMGGGEVDVIWPGGTRADVVDNTLILVFDGTEIAREGDSVRLSGGFRDQESPGCRTIEPRAWLSGSFI